MMSSEKGKIRSLADVNLRSVAKSESLPVGPDGFDVQTGVVEALLENIELYDRTCNGEKIEDMPVDCLSNCVVALEHIWALQRRA